MNTFTEDDLRWSSYLSGKVGFTRFDVHDDGDVEISIEVNRGDWHYLFMPVRELKLIVDTAEAWLKAKGGHSVKNDIS